MRVSSDRSVRSGQKTCPHSQTNLTLLSPLPADVEQTLLLPSRILSAHARYYIREMRIKAYAQLLESYRSLTMDSMCAAFGVGPEFMDKCASLPSCCCVRAIAMLIRLPLQCPAVTCRD